MENKRNRFFVLVVCLVAVLCAACSKGKGSSVNSDGQIGSSTSQTAATSQQTHGSGDNEIGVGDIGESVQTQKETGTTSEKTIVDKQNYLTTTTAKTTLASSLSGSSTAPSSTVVSPVTTDQDGFFPGHR